MGLMKQVSILLWKNCILQKRKYCASIIEMILPLVAALIILRLSRSASVKMMEPTYHDEISMESFGFETTYGYVPDNSEIDKIMNYVLNKSNHPTDNKVKIRSFPMENDALHYQWEHSESSSSERMSYLILFDVARNATFLDRNLSFTVRHQKENRGYNWNTGSLYPPFESSGRRPTTGSDSCQYPLYRGVAFLQYAIGEAFANYKDNRESSKIKFDLFIKCLIEPPYVKNPFISIMQYIFPALLVLGFLPLVIIGTNNLVHEKERKIKESMKLMGLSPAAYWMSWFITFCVFTFPAAIATGLLLTLPVVTKQPILDFTDTSLFCAFMLCYAVSLITFCFMISTIFQKANVAAIIAGVLFILFFVPYFTMNETYNEVTFFDKIAASLLFNTAMSLGALMLALHEGSEGGARWTSFYNPPTVEDNTCLMHFMLMLIVDSIIHFLIAWYIDNIRPGEFGVPQPYLFCFTKTYWFPNKGDLDMEYTPIIPDNQYFEKEPTEKAIGIQICDLKKKFGRKWAVAGTSLNIYEGQITCLLGHNGAGKTTTMAMLTGIVPPTSGTAIINNCDIRKNMAGARSSLGLCPQHDVLFDTLTVWEHLIFFLRLKDVSGSQWEEEVKEIISALGLEAKINDQSKTLSGGQKRKLSVGIALVGGSKVVILDEPSSGMDPAARRQMWTVLQAAKADRTMLLTTHFMDEADVLGDRIAIMADGVVKCCGSSPFLKKLFGAGYHLVIVKKHKCNIDVLTKTIQSFVLTATLDTIVNTEVSYILPDNESSKFSELFIHLDENKNRLRIDTFGTSATTMEEVFLKVGELLHDEDEEPVDTVTEIIRRRSSVIPRGSIVEVKPVGEDTAQDDKDKRSSIASTAHSGQSGSDKDNNTALDQDNPIVEESSPAETMGAGAADILGFNKGFTKATGPALIISRMHAIFVKKIILTWRNRMMTVFQLLVPLLFVILGLTSDAVSSKASEQEKFNPPLLFDLDIYGRTIVPYSDGPNATDRDKKFAKLYKEQFPDLHSLEYFSLTAAETFDDLTVNKAVELGTLTYSKKVVIGMEVLPRKPDEAMAATAYYNHYPYNSVPVAVQHLVNTFLQFLLDPPILIKGEFHPLPENVTKKEDDNMGKSSKIYFTVLYRSLTISVFISLGMAFLTTVFIFFPIMERQVGVKHLQIMTGLSPVMYWLPTFLWDFICYLIPCGFIIIAMLAFDQKEFIGDDRLAIFIQVLLAYGWAILPTMYALNFLFSTPGNGVVKVLMLNIFSGMVANLLVTFSDNPKLGIEEEGKLMNLIFRILFPNYNLAASLSNMYTNYAHSKFCEPFHSVCKKTNYKLPCCMENCSKFCLKFNINFFAWDKPGVGSFVKFMAIQGLLFWTIVFITEYHVLQMIWYKFRSSPESDPEVGNASKDDDSDVAEERKRINSSQISDLTSNNSLVLINLKKKYLFAKTISTNNICVAVPEKECFGLLGANGSGKTTTFKMLTGDIMVSGGNAYVKSFDVRSNVKKVQENIGYCPQFDPVIEQLTGYETLVMFARFRGIPGPNIASVIEGLSDLLLLTPHLNKRVGLYSGGNKRKLSTAVSLIGDPPLVLLDEPTSGMDPNARRHLWNVLSQIRDSGRTLVLTSHSMEECDALCTRLAIMVNGQFVCLGSPQHLKNKFAQGYTLFVNLGLLEDDNVAPNEPVIDFVISKFAGSKVFDEHEGFLHFQVPDSAAKLADIFSLMEETKTTLNVKDYSVLQTSLEQVFLAFVKGQDAPVK